MSEVPLYSAGKRGVMGIVEVFPHNMHMYLQCGVRRVLTAAGSL